MSRKKTTRNRKIYELYTTSAPRLSTYALARRFRITQPAILKIIQREQKQLEVQAQEEQV